MSDNSKTRENNNNWKGGRSLASNGYVLIRVGTNHPLADVRGYAYEHRIVAEQLLGRPLSSKEVIHHINGIKTDNRPENLEITSGNGHHLYRHRKNRRGLRLPGEPNMQMKCACGCGAIFLKYDKSGRPRKYISGHNIRDSHGHYKN